MFSARFDGFTRPPTRNALSKSRGIFHASLSGAMHPQSLPFGGLPPSIQAPGHAGRGPRGHRGLLLPSPGRREEKKILLGGQRRPLGGNSTPPGLCRRVPARGCWGGSLKRKGASLLGVGGFSSAAPSRRALSSSEWGLEGKGG